MKRGKFLDLVIGGPDMSGTSTQVQDIIKFFQKNDFAVRDIRGTEIDALFHTEVFQKEINSSWRKDYLDFRTFLHEVRDCASVTTVTPRDFQERAIRLLSEGGTNSDLNVASMVQNDLTTYIDPNSADVWIMEEPTKRGAGQVNRVIEQNRSKFGSSINPVAAAETHSVYRTDEFLRFRKPLRENGKIIIRSRSEESGCYQIYDEQELPNGPTENYYLNLSGHKVAFANSPTNIFIVCGPENWTAKDYLELKKQRSGKDRREDDHEKNATYQVLVNKRYASGWLENLYEKGCKIHGGIPPEITRFDIYASKEDIRKQMESKLIERLNSKTLCHKNIQLFN